MYSVVSPLASCLTDPSDSTTHEHLATSTCSIASSVYLLRTMPVNANQPIVLQAVPFTVIDSAGGRARDPSR